MLIDDEWVFSADSMSDFDFSSESRMLVFDKDGTLGDCIATMHKWIHFMTEKLSAHVSDREIQEYHRQLGWDGRKLVPSAPLAADTWEASIEKTARFLRVSNAYSIVDAWHRELGDLHGQDQPIIEQLPTMLETCRAMGWKIAVCTSDQREPTNQALKAWGIDSLVQVSSLSGKFVHILCFISHFHGFLRYCLVIVFYLWR
jgi:phosphoglycolate phosphatase-like HAD superfamily hydrolase